uniref:Tf2-1-like SH3-like domain-containing protein n=1 Tax=Tanacetum cinerariifolium TaxID=118510 RepID=A0A699I9H4_TANCI|nr:hypothetical protein [Tanacetum cinerariifolium]
MGEPSKDKNGRDDNKRTRTGNVFATTVNPVGREKEGAWPKCTTYNSYHASEDLVAHASTVTTRGRGNQENQARGRAFMLGAEEARQDPNIMTGTFTLNDHYATTVFDSGADCSFIFTTFIPLLGIEPSEIGFRFEIEISNEQLVEIDKWYGKVLRVLKEKLDEKMRQLKSAKAKDKKQREIVVVRYFPEEKLYAKVCKCEFWLREVMFLRHVINGNGIYVDPSKIEVVKNWKYPRTLIEPKRVRAMNMILQSSIKDKILAGQKDTVDEFTGLQRGLDKMIEQRSDGTLYYLDRIWVSLKGEVRTLIMDEAHKSKYYVHLGADKMYYDLRDRPSGLLWQPEIPVWKWEGITIDIVSKLPRTSSGHDTIWIIMDQLNKSAHSLPMRVDYKMDRLYLNETVARHGTCLDMSAAYHPQTDGQSEHTIQTLEDMLRACVLDFEGSWDVHFPLVEFLYNNSYHSCVRCTSFEALYGRNFCSAIIYANKRRKPLEFSEGDYVLLKMLPWKGVLRFGKKGKLAPRFVRPFEIFEKVDHVAYRLDLPEEFNGVLDMFHVSNLKKCLADLTLKVPLDEI